MKVGIVVFPGSNCDHDAYWAVKEVMDTKSNFIWHRETDLDKYDLLILPGGFSYGDYLRSGAIARFSPVMTEVRRLAHRGTPVIGICNGFQILTEAGLLPGALTANESMKFECRTVHIRTNTNRGIWVNQYHTGDILAIPIAHGEGRYVAEDDIIKELQDEDLIAFQYCDAEGKITKASNPNGSIHNIAGIMNKTRNVLGMMPHPERVVETLLGGEDGQGIFKSVLESVG